MKPTVTSHLNKYYIYIIYTYNIYCIYSIYNIYTHIHTYEHTHKAKHLSDVAALVAIRTMLVMECMRELVDDYPTHAPETPMIGEALSQVTQL